MSESPAPSKNTPASRTRSECVTPQRTSGFHSSLMDGQLLGAWDALPDADTPPRKAPQDDEKLIVPRMPALSRHQDNGPVQSIRPTPATAAPNRQAAPALATPPKAYSQPPAIESPARSFAAKPLPATTSTSRPTTAFVPSQPRSTASFRHNMVDFQKWTSGAMAVAALVVASYWGVSTVMGSSSPPLETIAVKGKVTLNGKPIPGASIQLHPVPGSQAAIEVHPRGLAGDDSQVEFTTFQPKDGVPAGEYVATVSYMRIKVVNGESVAGPQLVPAIYTKASTSPLRVKVSSETRDLPTLQVTQSSRGQSAR